MNKLLRISNDQIYDARTATCYSLSLDAVNGDVLTIETPSDTGVDRRMQLGDGAAHNLWAYLVRYSRDERTSAQRASDHTAAVNHTFEILLSRLRFAAVEETYEEMQAAIKEALSEALAKQVELDEL